MLSNFYSPDLFFQPFRKEFPGYFFRRAETDIITLHFWSTGALKNILTLQDGGSQHRVRTNDGESRAILADLGAYSRK